MTGNPWIDPALFLLLLAMLTGVLVAWVVLSAELAHNNLGWSLVLAFTPLLIIIYLIGVWTQWD